MLILLTTKWDTVPEHTGDSWRSCYPASHLHTSGPRYWEKTETITQGHMATFKISSLPYPNQCKCGRLKILMKILTFILKISIIDILFALKI